MQAVDRRADRIGSSAGIFKGSPQDKQIARGLPGAGREVVKLAAQSDGRAKRLSRSPHANKGGADRQDRTCHLGKVAGHAGAGLAGDVLHRLGSAGKSNGIKRGIKFDRLSGHLLGGLVSRIRRISYTAGRLLKSAFQRLRLGGQC